MTLHWPVLSDPAKQLRDELFGRLWRDGWSLVPTPNPEPLPEPSMEDHEPPHQYGSAEALHGSISYDAVAVALYDHQNRVRGYELHGRGGPWLLTVAAYDDYLRLCAQSAS